MLRLLLSFVSVQTCYILVYCEKPTTTNLPEGRCYVSTPSTGFPETLPLNHLNPRYRRAILAASGAEENYNIENSNTQSETNQEGFNQDPRFSRIMHPVPREAFSPQRNVGYYSHSVEKLNENNRKPQEQYFSRQSYPAYDGSSAPPVTHQGQFPSVNSSPYLEGSTPLHSFSPRNCPYCNSPLPPELYQRQLVLGSNQFQHPESISTQFNQQYQSGYQNINPLMKTTPTIATEEMCPYDNGSPPEPPILPSPSLASNETMQAVPEMRESLGIEQYRPRASDPPNFMAKNLQTSQQGMVTLRDIKTGMLPQQASRYVKMQRTGHNIGRG